MKYTIGDVARTLGLTPGALHYFEREGIISPEKEKGGRRLYTNQDVFRLMSYKKYRAMGVPVRDIAHQFSRLGDSPSDVARMLSEKKQEAARQEAHYRMVKENIQWFKDAIARIPALLNQWDVCASPEALLLRTEPDGLVPPSRAAQMEVQAWLQMLPQTRLSVTLDMEGRAFFAQTCREDPLPTKQRREGITYLKPAISLHTIVALSDGPV